ncbi:MAG: AarF/ABC1/UbiB kinase family protein [Deferribacterota bacterium]|nr:AarF/ABC1/UbiB kinase family protein [Deferribacterota bacterium]
MDNAKKITYFARIREILFLFIKFGFINYLEDIKLSKVIRYIAKIFTLGRLGYLKGIPTEVRLRQLIEALGTTFIKVGQFLQIRSELLPENYIKELRKLNDSVASQEFEQIKEVIEGDFKKNIDEIFDYIEEKPVASASIAQVHRARLKNGDIVALKVKRKGITNRIKIDLKIIKWLARRMQKYLPEARRFNFLELADEFASQLLKELDFVLEANYIEDFRNFFKNEENLKIPKVYFDYTSNNIITMEFLEGIPIDNVSDLKNKGINTGFIAKYGVNIYLKQVFEHNIFHADPHPGNFLISGDGKLILLDFGIIGKVDKQLLVHLGNLFIAIIKFDVDGLTNELRKYGLLKEDTNIRSFRNDLFDILLTVYDKEIKRIDMNKLYYNFMELSRRYNIKLSRDYILIIKTFSFLEYYGRKLSPDFNAIAELRPYANRIIKEKYRLEYLFSKSGDVVFDYIKLVDRLPSDYSMLVEKFAKDRITINFVHKGLDGFATDISKASNKLSFSVIIGATILASSIFVYTGVGPKLFNIPIFGLIGFLIAGVLGLGLAVGILRSGKL